LLHIISLDVADINDISVERDKHNQEDMFPVSVFFSNAIGDIQAQLPPIFCGCPSPLPELGISPIPGQRQPLEY